jgi:hypothetical protein
MTMKTTTPTEKSAHLSLVPSTNDKLTRAQVAGRIGVSVPTVRRLEGSALHPHVDAQGVHWFDPREVTAVAASRANEALMRGKIRNAQPAAEIRTRGEIAALVYERFEQRQSQAEIVIGLRIEPETVRELFDQYCRGLIEGQLAKKRPGSQLQSDLPCATSNELARLLAALPTAEVTRISVGRWRGVHAADDLDHAWIVELGGFLVTGPCSTTEITSRFGRGSYRVSAYGFAPAGLRWELLVEAVGE